MHDPTTDMVRVVVRLGLGFGLGFFEVLILTRYRNIKGDAKCRKWSGLGWLGVTQGH